MTTDGSATPVRTLRWGGAGVAVAGLLLLVRAVAISVPFPEALSVGMGGCGHRLLAALVLTASTVVLAVGLPGERGVVGTRRRGRVALVAMGAQDLGFLLIGFAVPPAATEVAAPLVVGNVVWQVAAVPLAIASAVLVARSGVVRGVSRFAFVPVAVLQALLTGAQLVPDARVVPVREITGLLLTAAVLAAGIALAGQGFAAGRLRPAAPEPERG